MTDCACHRVLAGDGIGQLVQRPGGGGNQTHVLHTPEPVRLVIFKDGLQVCTRCVCVRARGWVAGVIARVCVCVCGVCADTNGVCVCVCVCRVGWVHAVNVETTAGGVHCCVLLTSLRVHPLAAAQEPRQAIQRPNCGRCAA